jgi:hypothetical protein
VLAVATAVNNANAGPTGSPSDLLDGFQAAAVVSLIVAVLGFAAATVRRREPAAEPAAEAA